MDKLTGKVIGVRSVLGDNGSAGEVQRLVTIKLDRLPGPESCLWLGQEFMFAQMPAQESTDTPGTGASATEEEPTGEPEPSSVTPDEPAGTIPPSEAHPKDFKVCGECGVPLPTGRGSHLRRYCKECAPKVAKRKKKEGRERRKKKSGKKSATAVPPSSAPKQESDPAPATAEMAAEPGAAHEAGAVANIIEFATKMVDQPGSDNMFLLLDTVQTGCQITPVQMGMMREQHGDEWVLDRCRSEAGLKELAEVAATMKPKKVSREIAVDLSADGIVTAPSIADGEGVSSAASIEEAVGLPMTIIKPRNPLPTM